MIVKKCWFIFFLIITLSFTSCSTSSDIKEWIDPEWVVKHTNLKRGTTHPLRINRIKLPSFTYSYDGNWICGDSSIFLYDNLFRTVSEIGLNGSLIKQLGGIDTLQKPNNWWLPYTLSKYGKGYSSIFLRSIAYLDNSFNVETIKEIKFEGKTGMLSMLDVPDPFNMNAYELNERNSNFLQISKDEFLVSLESETPAFNPYNSSEYYKKALSFGLVNVKKSTLIGVPIRKSKIYQNNCCLSVQDASYIIKKDGEYHVQFAADTLIYVYDSTFKPKIAYGLKGVFKQNFLHNDGLEIAFEEEKYQMLQKKANTIDGLFLVAEKYVGRLVNNRTERKKYVQIFLNFDLIAEFEVPVTFQFIGIIKGQIIGITAQDESNEKLEICILN